MSRKILANSLLLYSHSGLHIQSKSKHLIAVGSAEQARHWFVLENMFCHPLGDAEPMSRTKALDPTWPAGLLVEQFCDPSHDKPITYHRCKKQEHKYVHISTHPSKWTPDRIRRVHEGPRQGVRMESQAIRSNPWKFTWKLDATHGRDKHLMPHRKQHDATQQTTPDATHKKDKSAMPHPRERERERKKERKSERNKILTPQSRKTKSLTPSTNLPAKPMVYAIQFQHTSCGSRCSQ